MDLGECRYYVISASKPRQCQKNPRRRAKVQFMWTRHWWHDTSSWSLLCILCLTSGVLSYSFALYPPSHILLSLVDLFIYSIFFTYFIIIDIFFIFMWLADVLCYYYLLFPIQLNTLRFGKKLKKWSITPMSLDSSHEILGREFYALSYLIFV